MHELGIAESAIRSALHEMERHNAKILCSVTLRIGTLSCVDPEALKFAFEAVTRCSGLEGTQLNIETVEAVAVCRNCNQNFPTNRGIFLECPACGGYTSELIQGKEIELARLELE